MDDLFADTDTFTKEDAATAKLDFAHYKSEFLKCFRMIAPEKHRYDVFRDFVTISACSLHNAIHMDMQREEEYMSILHTYKKEDQKSIPALFGMLVAMLDYEPRDVLGILYMELEISSKDKGQFFTPQAVSDLMAEMTYGEDLKALDKPFITLSEPACGAGGMVLAFVKTMINAGHNPAEKLWVQCIDVDRCVALMCYVQLSLWNIPGEVVVGNCLSLEVREMWRTPQHHLGFWKSKLARKSQEEAAEHEANFDEETSMPDQQDCKTASQEVRTDQPFTQELDDGNPIQMDLF